MIKRLIGLLSPKREKNKPRFELRVIPRDAHNISRKSISPNALKVLYRLNGAGYEAFLVGGGVRDLLLGVTPKDFDVATNAHPEEVREQFQNARLIGRRFRLAHVRFGREIIEVATFRREHGAADEEDSPDGSMSEGGMILRDNVYGNQQEDALRRDFTINALYYSVRDFAIHDYAGGLEDLKARQIRMIGDAETRFREDPVRMLRAVRFATKLDFEIAPDTAAPMPALATLLRDIPPARLFEEVLKLFLSGKAVANFDMMRHYGLFAPLFPATERAIERGGPEVLALIRQALANTDERIAQDKPVTPAFLYAALLWPPLQERQARIEGEGMPPIPAMQQAANEVISEQVRHTALPKRFSIPMKEIWEMQQRLTRRGGKRAELLLEHPRFRAGYDFLLLREQTGEDLGGLGDWWTEFQEASAPDREQLATQARSEESGAPAKRKRRSRSRKRRYNNRPPTTDQQ